ncbi:MAG: hypothetical protein AAF747_05325 [Planctomycetota bacterium]
MPEQRPHARGSTVYVRALLATYSRTNFIKRLERTPVGVGTLADLQLLLTHGRRTHLGIPAEFMGIISPWRNIRMGVAVILLIVAFVLQLLEWIPLAGAIAMYALGGLWLMWERSGSRFLRFIDLRARALRGLCLRCGGSVAGGKMDPPESCLVACPKCGEVNPSPRKAVEPGVTAVPAVPPVDPS